MKETIEKHISEILTILQIDSPFVVYDCRVDILPEWTSQIRLTHEYLIFCGEITEIQKLKRFIGKDIFTINGNSYWFEGDIILEIKNDENEIINLKQEEKVDFLKTNTRLPSFLDDLIFNQLNAEYSPDFKRFEFNLDLTKDESKKYLGTYFPRSYAESFCIFDNIFENKYFQNTIFKKKTLNVLSVGCGTGGDLIGLLTVIEKYCNLNNTINIWAIDGNDNALKILTRIVDFFKITSKKKINLNTLQLLINSETGNYDLKNEITKLEYDFITSFKMITEIISAGKGKADNSYFQFLKTFAPLLTETGLLVLLDVTTKQEHNNTFNPILMNDQVKSALKELKKFKTLLPLSCSLHESVCCAMCFTQQQFIVSHSKRSNDISKVAYRIIANNEFVKQLSQPDATAKYLIGKGNVCCYTEGNYKNADSYLLEKQSKH